MTPSDELYFPLLHAFKRMNQDLFDRLLPDVIISVQRKSRRTKGYFTLNNYQAIASGARTHEISLNPAYFGQAPAEILATLGHELCHLWQHEHGKPGRGRYHNRQWAKKMEVIGLQPSDTGLPGGKTTGQHVAHYAILGGPFDQFCKALLAEGWGLKWAELVAEVEKRDAPEPEEKSKGRVPWVCPTGCTRAWARPTTKLKCGFCDHLLERV